MKSRFVQFQFENSENFCSIERKYYRDFRHAENVHSNAELIYVISGSMEIIIDDNSMYIPEEHYCMILPWQVHAIRTEERSHCAVFVFSPQYVGNFAHEISGHFSPCQVFEADPDVHSLFLRYMMQENFPDKYMISCVLLGLCHCFAKNCPLQPRSENKKIAGLFDVIHYIYMHCGDRISLRQVADTLGYSYYHLSHIFNNYVGMSFAQFCNGIRINCALEELGKDKLSMTDIAYRCGFSSVRNFNRVFSQMLGVTPSEYKRKAADSQRTVPKTDGSDGLVLPGWEDARQ